MRPLFLIASVLLFASNALTQGLWIRRSPTVDTNYFEAITAIGDVNGDGCSDLAKPVRYSPGKPIPQAPFDVFHVISGRDHRVLFAIQSSVEDAWLGFGLGDLDRDGAADFAVTRYSSSAIWIEVYSGRSRRKIFTFKHASLITSGILCLANAGDVNADSTDDLLLGCPRMNNYGGCLVISGKDGSLIHNVSNPLFMGHRFGSSVCAAGDVNKDGHADFYVSDVQSGFTSYPYGVNGSVVLFSGKDAKLLGQWHGNRHSWFGNSLLLGPDLDKDGVRELLVGAPGYGPAVPGVVYRINPRKAQQIQTYKAPSTLHVGYGAFLALAGDWDADGTDDFYSVAGIYSSSTGMTNLSLLVSSGASGAKLWEHRDPGSVKNHSVEYFSSGDINGDKRVDLVLGLSPWRWPNPSVLPYYEIWCDSLALRSNERSLSLSAKGTQHFELDAGPKYANAPYILLGSLSGVAPGLPLGRSTLPLNPDPYLLFTLTAPNSALLPGGLGTLDAQGKARARFVAIPGLPPSLAGIRIDHAFLCFDRQGPAFCSNWIPLVLTK